MLENKANDIDINEQKANQFYKVDVDDVVIDDDENDDEETLTQEFIRNSIGNHMPKNITSSVDNKKAKWTNMLFAGILISLSLIIIYRSFNVDKVKSVFSVANTNIPSLPTKKDDKALISNSIASATNAGQKVTANNQTNLTNQEKTSITKVNSQNTKGSWQRVDELLASTEQRRNKLFAELGINKREYVLACVSVNCSDCDDIALELNQKTNLANIIAITSAPKQQAKEWKERLGLTYRVESLSERAFDDSGVVLLPTLIKVKNGKAIAASESAKVIN